MPKQYKPEKSESSESSSDLPECGKCKRKPKRDQKLAPVQGDVTCPVCNDYADVQQPKARLHLKNGQTLYFACEKCVDRFVKEPGKYIVKPQ